MTHGHAALLHGRGSQRGKSDHVSGRVDVTHARLVMIVHVNVAALIDAQAGFFQGQAFDCAATSGGKQRRLGFHSLS